jgi:hypothetical protein
MKYETITFTVPEWILPVVANGDVDNLTDEEEKTIFDFWTENKIQSMDWSGHSEPYFHWKNDVFGIIGDTVVDIDCLCLIEEE